MLNAIKYELPLKLLALLIATGLWAYVVVHQNPTTLVRRTLDVRVANVGKGLLTSGVTPGQVQMTLKGRYSVISSDAMQSVWLEADVTGQGPGTVRVPLRVRNPLRDVEVASDAGVATVTLDRVTTTQRPVIVNLLGSVAEGYAGEKTHVEPDRVYVTGAAAMLARIAKVAADVDASGLSSQRTLAVPVQARDERDMPVEGVEIRPRTVNVTIGVVALPYKVVVVWPRLSAPRAGYALTAVSPSPSTVMVTGDAGRVRALRYAVTKTIDISGLEGSRQYVTDLALPPGLRPLGADHITVSVTTVKLQPTTAEAAPPGPVSPQPREAPLEGNREQSGTPPLTSSRNGLHTAGPGGAHGMPNSGQSPGDQGSAGQTSTGNPR